MLKKTLLITSALFLLAVPTVSAATQENNYEETNKSKTKTKIKITLPAPLALNSVNPNKASFEDTIKLKGQSFGENAGMVIFYNQSGQAAGGAPILKWSEKEIKVMVPAVAPHQVYNLEVQTADGKKSNTISFSMEDGQPLIDTINPDVPGPNATHIVNKSQVITFTGAEYGDSKGKINFYLGNTNDRVAKAKIISWSNTQISFIIPEKLDLNQEYGVQIETADDRHSSFKYFLIN